jgi:hypothetical protein
MKHESDVNPQRPKVDVETHHRFREAAGALHITVAEAYDLGSVILITAAKKLAPESRGNVEALKAEIERLFNKKR